jgi:hypothetical protein
LLLDRLLPLLPTNDQLSFTARFVDGDELLFAVAHGKLLEAEQGAEAAAVMLSRALAFAADRRPDLLDKLTAKLERERPAALLDYFAERDDHLRAVALLDRHEVLYAEKATYDLLLSHAASYPAQVRRLYRFMLDKYLPVADRRRRALMEMLGAGGY